MLGSKRGADMIKICEKLDNVQLVAICERCDLHLEQLKATFELQGVTIYSDFEEFIEHNMDAVILANSADQHAAFAIKAMENGKHVLSEVLPVQTLKEAVELIEAVEATGKIYAYAENFCYMRAAYEMKRLYQAGKIGEFEYGEGEYIHNCEPMWEKLTYGDKNHWRNRMYANFYCTHSIGPLIHITGLRPVLVSGMEGGMMERHMRVGAAGGQYGIEMITLDNGGMIKSLHGELYKKSIWFSVYGSKGRMESAREDAKQGEMKKIYVNADAYSGEYREEKLEVYEPEPSFPEITSSGVHSADFGVVYHFVKKILGDDDADIIDVYEAMDMFLPGMFAYRSVLNGGAPQEIPNLREKAVRDKYRYDVACVDESIAGEQRIPSFSKGDFEIDDKVYETMKQKWLDGLDNK